MKFIFKSGDICKVCNCRVWYYSNQWYCEDNKLFVICPTCNNEIQITKSL